MTRTNRRRTARKRNDHTFLKLLGIALIAAAVAIGVVWASRKKTADEAAVAAVRSDAAALLDVAVPDGTDEQLVAYTGYTVSFNPGLRIPNYVAYELLRSETEGSEPRARHFKQDTSVDGCPEPSDYTNSGYDRGHMAPAADMKWDEQAMRESFFMTNICPQNHSLNSGAWKGLEEKVRDWAARDSSLIVVTGPVTGASPKRLPSGVAVPEGFFKVLLAPFATPPRGIAFVYKNEGGQKRIERQAVSIDEVEAVTGLDFFRALPDSIEERVEQSCNFNEWNN